MRTFGVGGSATPTGKRSATTVRALGLLAALLVALVVPAQARALGDLDTRTGHVEPTAAQLQTVSSLGALATWNDFGTPESLVKSGGWLATGVAGGTAAEAARNWVESKKALFRLVSLENLSVLQDSKLGGSSGHAVTFRQTWGGRPAAEGGLLTVGLTKTAAGWSIVSASGSTPGDAKMAGTATLSAAAAWVAAAADVGHSLSVVQVADKGLQPSGWRVLALADPGFGRQLAREVAVPIPGGGVVPAWQVIFYKNEGAQTYAYESYVDATSGKVLVRKNIVEHAVAAPYANVFSGDFTPLGCGPAHPIGAVSNAQSIDVQATANVPANDIVLQLLRNGVVVQAADTATSPEFIHYTGTGTGVPPGTYSVRVCEYNNPTASLCPTECGYTGSYQVNDVVPGEAFPYPPKWKHFPTHPLTNPQQGFPWGNLSTDIRELWCWDARVNGSNVPGCDRDIGNLACPAPGTSCTNQSGNLASRPPWDADPVTGFNTPTYETRGNNANSREGWLSPDTIELGVLTPGATGHAPKAPDRNYTFEWSNDWFNSKCDRAQVSPAMVGTGNDINAAAVNLFVLHNRLHDWSYRLGFTEENWNAQDVNFGLTQISRQNDSVIGDVQVGAQSGGSPTYGGRDNANMVTLPDGVHPITNMYLWQPLSGAFYSPCVDGDYDGPVVGHEYAHLIENRMIGKGGTRSGHHAGAMGESNGDLNGMEMLNEYSFGGKSGSSYLGFPNSGENPYALGAYVTGNKLRAIRNYGMNFPYTGAFPAAGQTPAVNPLNFGDIGYDITGAQVHADGEIWSAVNFDIRRDLIAKYNASFPATNLTLQRQCADGQLTADRCPGNRRWIQLVYDAYLLMPVEPSMLTARNMYLAADQLRSADPTLTWPSNQNELWLAFARRGFGRYAYSSTGPGDPAGTPDRAVGNDVDPRPDFESRNHGFATITFNALRADGNSALPAPKARIYVGHYEARVSPVADTDAATNAPPLPGVINNLDQLVRFAPGTYEFVANAPGYGFVRFRLTFTAGQTQTYYIYFPTNFASRFQGATASGDGTQHLNLIDDTEASNWDYTGTSVNTSNPKVTVDLPGTAPRTINHLGVSAMLHMVSADSGQNRFTALRQFEIRVCTASTANVNCTSPTAFNTVVYTSAANFFPGVVPRPVGPELLWRTFWFPSVSATHVQIRVLHNQCTGQPQFQGEQDNDLTNATDCRAPGTGTVQPFGDLPSLLGNKDVEVHIAELTVYGRGGGVTTSPTTPPADPVVTVTKTASPTTRPGATLTYTIEYRNLGPNAASNSTITDFLPSGLTFVSATGGGTYNSSTRTVKWSLGSVPVGKAGSVTLTARVSATAQPGSVIINTATYQADLTVATPTGTATTLVLP